MNWMILKDKGEQIEFRDEMIPEKAVGFVYVMYAWIDGKCMKYIGKKNFYSQTKKKMGKKQLALVTDKRLKQYTIEKKLNYKNYYSSNEVLKEYRKNIGDIHRVIIEICYSNIELTYKEVKHQFLHEVLEKEDYLNNNILGKFYKTTS